MSRYLAEYLSQPERMIPSDVTGETPQPGPSPGHTQTPTHESFHGSLLNFPMEGNEQPPSNFRGDDPDDRDNNDGDDDEEPSDDPAGNKI